MNSNLLAAMLTSRAEVKVHDGVYAPAEDAGLSLLLVSNGGPVPLSKVKQLVLATDFVTAETPEATFVLPYAAIAGVRVEAVQTKQSGFRR